MIKKVLVTIIVSLIFCVNIYADETSTAQQKEAIEWFEKAISIDTPELEIEYLTKAIELDPENIWAYYFRGLAYCRRGLNNAFNSLLRRGRTFDLSKEIAERVKIAGYKEAIGDFIWAKTFAKTKKDKEKMVIEIARTYFDIAKAYSEIKEYGDAKSALTTVLIYCPHAFVYYERGICNLNLKFPVAACDDFYQAGVLFLEEKRKQEERFEKLESFFSKYDYKQKVLECIDYMKIADPSSPLIKKLMDKIYAEPKKKN